MGHPEKLMCVCVRGEMKTGYVGNMAVRPCAFVSLSVFILSREKLARLVQSPHLGGSVNLSRLVLLNEPRWWEYVHWKSVQYMSSMPRWLGCLTPKGKQGQALSALHACTTAKSCTHTAWQPGSNLQVLSTSTSCNAIKHNITVNRETPHWFFFLSLAWQQLETRTLSNTTLHIAFNQILVCTS